MNDSLDPTIEAQLEGGPDHLPTAMRRHRASASDQQIKLEYCGGYEHFERVAADDIVFRWTTRTRMAE